MYNILVLQGNGHIKQIDKITEAYSIEQSFSAFSFYNAEELAGH